MYSMNSIHPEVEDLSVSSSDGPINMCIRDKKQEELQLLGQNGSNPSSQVQQTYSAPCSLVEEEGTLIDEHYDSTNSTPVLQEQVVHTTEKRGKMIGKPSKDKTCLVCGDKALGYNFNAVSCESCKAFFRRNAFKEIRGRCEGKCDVTVESRSYCKKCRLQKCFTVGMKKDLILSDKQKQQRRQKIYSNRLRRMGVPCSEGEELAQEAEQESEEGPSVIHIKEEPDVKTHTFTSCIAPGALVGLPEQTRLKIEELIKAFQNSFDCPIERNPVLNPNNTEFLNMADMSVRRLVKMSKMLASFQALKQEDQIALLKGAVVEVLILRSAKLFDASALGWSVARDGAQHTISSSYLQCGNEESMEFFQQYRRFASGVMSSARKDNIILMFLIVLAVLSPDRPNVKNKECVARAQEEYAVLLKDYIHHCYADDTRIFPRVLQKLADIRELNEAHTRMLLHMRVDQLEPLIIEIFDLSS